MTKQRGQIQVYGPTLPDIEPDLLAQLVLMLARQLAQETLCDGVTPGGPPPEDRGEAASA